MPTPSPLSAEDREKYYQIVETEELRCYYSGELLLFTSLSGFNVFTPDRLHFDARGKIYPYKMEQQVPAAAAIHRRHQLFQQLQEQEQLRANQQQLEQQYAGRVRGARSLAGTRGGASKVFGFGIFLNEVCTRN